jgi:membrane-associated protein
MNIENWLHAAGSFGALAIVFAIIFAESGLLIGFFLPGDTLLFSAGILAASGLFGNNGIIWLCLSAFLGAVIGDNVGYTFGRRVGRRIFAREDSVLFHKDNLKRAEDFYKKHGSMTIILARFVPIVRTFAPVVAGMGKMERSVFLTFNIIGGLLWGVGISLAGYFLGQLVPEGSIDKYILPVILTIVVVSVVPSAYHVLKDEQSRKEIWAQIKKLTKRKS